MNLIDPTAPLTMTSREIAEMTGKNHSDVMRDIRGTLAQVMPLGSGGVSNFADTQVNEQNGQAYPIFRLPKRETLILVSGYSVTMRAKIIDRWQELEAKQAPVVPMTLAGALRLALAQAEELEAKTLEVAAQALRIEHLKPAAAVGAMVAKHRHTLDQVARTFPG